MNVLLDTHTLLWFLNGDESLSARARTVIEDIRNQVFVSIASLWEISIKLSLGKLEYKFGLIKIAQLIEENGFLLLPITFDHTLIVSTLEFIHRDPFDRIITAQAIHEKMVILTKDSNIAQYKAKTSW